MVYPTWLPFMGGFDPYPTPWGSRNLIPKVRFWLLALAALHFLLVHGSPTQQ